MTTPHKPATPPTTGPADTTKGERDTQPTTEPEPQVTNPPEKSDNDSKVFATKGYIASFNVHGYDINQDGVEVAAADVDKVKEAAKANGVELREIKVKD